MFVVYGKPNCINCDKAKAMLNSAGFEFDYVDVTKDQKAFDRLSALGLKSLPQVWDKNNVHYPTVEDLREAIIEMM